MHIPDILWLGSFARSLPVQTFPSCVSCTVECPDVYIVERLFSSSLVVVVSLSMPRRMNVYHFKKGTEICNYSYSNNILAVKLNRQVSFKTSPRKEPFLFLTCANLTSWSLSQRLVVCLEESIYIHNIKDMKLLKTLLNTPTNLSGTLSPLFLSLIRLLSSKTAELPSKCTYTQATDL